MAVFIAEPTERSHQEERTYRNKKSVHIERRWATTSIRGCGSGRQDCPTGRGHYPQPDLRGRLSRLLVRFSPRTVPRVHAQHEEASKAELGAISILRTGESHRE